MEPIDAAFEKFRELKIEIDSYSDSIFTEQDTRVKVIDRIVLEVLNWPLAELATESQAGTGFIDYKFSHNGLARLIVEAKRDGRELGATALTAGRAYKLSGPTLKTEAIQEGIEQAIIYCAHKNAELACVTNGREWVVFRGSRLGDGRDTREGMAIVFPSLEGVEQQFALFYDLLAYQTVQEFKFRAVFQEAEGRPIRHSGFSRCLRDPNARQMVPHSTFASDVDRVMTSFFRRLSGDDDPDLILKCFVETSQSKEADQRLARISEDLIGSIRSLDTASGDELQGIIERAKATQRNTFVVIIGTKGAGKSTFVQRFFKYILPPEILDYCLVTRLNVADSKGEEATISAWLDRELLTALESAVFAEKEPDFSDFEGMFFDEYNRWRTGTLKPLYDSDKQKFQIDFGLHVEDKRKNEPHLYIQRLLQHAVRVRRKLPILIFDNTDHFSIDFQERVFQYARSLYEKELCLVILPITDRTSWQIAREGALRTFEYESLYLPVPPTHKVLQSRVEFIEERIAEEEREPGRGYFLGRGITLSLQNLKAFVFCLNRIFVQTGHVSHWIGDLSNGDIRTSLEIVKEIVMSPHLGLDNLFKTFVAKTTIDVPDYLIQRALMKGRFNMYPGLDNRFVRNVFSRGQDEESNPLLGMRMLAVLRDTRDQTPENPFITVSQLTDYFQAMGIEFKHTLGWLDYFLKSGLSRSYDPTVLAAAHAQRVEMTPCGERHYVWATGDETYLRAMMEVTPILKREAFDRIDSAFREEGRQGRLTGASLCAFLEYIIELDGCYVRIPDLPAYECQRLASRELQAIRDKLDRKLRKADWGY